MPQKRNRWLSVVFMLVATFGLMTASPSGARAESVDERLSDLGDAWRGIRWVGFVSVEAGVRTVHGGAGPVDPMAGTYLQWETAGYGRTGLATSIRLPSELADGTANAAAPKPQSPYLITVAFDSRDKQQQQLLADGSAFQYPVLGDGSLLRKEASSRGPVYLRVEQGSNYFLYGDYRTELTRGQLLVFDRYLTGSKLHYERASGPGRFQTTMMAARSRQRSKTEWLPSLGTVGFYRLDERRIVPGSEQVHIATVGTDDGVGGALARRLQRDVDYTIDYFDGTVLLKEPLPMADAQGNTYELVVRYEYESDAAALQTTAARLGYEAASWRLGLTYVQDGMSEGAGRGRQALGFDGEVVVTPWLRVEGEWASASFDEGGASEQGDAYRVALAGDISQEWGYRLTHHRQSAGFVPLHGDGPDGMARDGIGARLTYRPSLSRPRTSLRTTLTYDIENKTPFTSGLVGLTRARTTLDTVYGRDAWTWQGRVESGRYGQLGGAADRWTATGYRLSAAYRFAAGHELGAFRSGSTATSSVTGLSDVTGMTGIHYDHRLDDRTDLSAGYGLTDDGHHRLWTGVARRVVDGERLRTGVYTRYQLERTGSATRTGTVVGVNNRWQVTDAVAVDFGYERTEGPVGGAGGGGSSSNPPGPSLPGTPPGTAPGGSPAPTGVKEAWNASVLFAPDSPYRLGLVYSVGERDGRTRQHIQLSGVGQLADDWSVSAVWSLSTLPETVSGRAETGRQRQTFGVAYRPLYNSRINALFAFEREKASRRASASGTAGAGGSVDETRVFSAEASYWATSALEIAGRVAQRQVLSGPAVGSKIRTNTTLYQVRGTYMFAPRWDGTLLYRTLRQHPTVGRPMTIYQAGYQASVGFAFVEADPRWRMEAGYRYADFAPEDDPSADAFVEGPFVRLTYRF